MAKNKIRTPIPAEIERLVNVEAGFRCSMPRCPNTSPLEMHHIDGDPGNHDLGNLLVLCRNCHGRVTKGEIKRKDCEMIKREVSIRPLSKADLESLKSEIISEIRQVVGTQDRLEPFTEEMKASQPSDPKIEAAGGQAITYQKAGVLLPVKLLHLLAFKLYESDDLPQALAVLESLTAIDPNHAMAWSDRGAVLDDLERYDEAENAYRKAIAADPNYAGAWYNLGNLLDKLKRHDEAEAAYRKAVVADPSHANAWNNLGSLLCDLGRHDEAEDAYRKAIAADPEDCSALSNLVNLLAGQNREEDIEKLYRDQIALDPDDADLRNQLAYLLVTGGRFDEACDEAKRALEIEPRHCYANATLGLALFEKNDWEGGARRYERAIKIDPEDLPLQQKFHYEYARVLSRNGFTSLARQQFKQAAQVQSDFVPLESIEAELAKLPE